MTMTLRRWDREGRSSRLYVNGYVEQGAVWLERAADGGVAVKSTRDAGTVDAAALVALLASTFSVQDPTWDGLEAAAAALAAQPVETPSSRPARKPAWSPWTAMDTALIEISGLGLRMQDPVAVTVGTDQPDELAAALSKIPGITVERAEPAWGDVAAGPDIAFVRRAVSSMAGLNPGPASGDLPAAPVPSGVRAFMILEGAPATPSNSTNYNGYMGRLARVAMTVPVLPSLSVAQTAHAVASMIRAVRRDGRS